MTIKFAHLICPQTTYQIPIEEVTPDGGEAEPYERILWQGFGFQLRGKHPIDDSILEFESESPAPPDSIFK